MSVWNNNRLARALGAVCTDYLLRVLAVFSHKRVQGIVVMVTGTRPPAASPSAAPNLERGGRSMSRSRPQPHSPDSGAHVPARSFSKGNLLAGLLVLD